MAIEYTEKMNFICFTQDCLGYFTLEIPPSFLYAFRNTYGKWIGNICPKCGKNAKFIGYPAGLAQEIKKHNDGRRRDEDRRVHAKDILQPHRYGEPSREFIEAYPKESKRYFTPEERKKAKYVWKDLK